MMEGIWFALGGLGWGIATGLAVALFIGLRGGFRAHA